MVIRLHLVPRRNKVLLSVTEQNLESLGPIEPFQEAGLGKPSVLATTEPRARLARA